MSLHSFLAKNHRHRERVRLTQEPSEEPKPGYIDVLPHLCVLYHERRLPAALGPHLDAGLDRVANAAPYHDGLPSHGPGVLRPYGQSWPPDTARNVSGLPPVFRRYFLWGLRDSPWTLIAKVLSAYWALSLEEDRPLRTCIGELFSMSFLTPTVVARPGVVARWRLLHTR